MRFFVPVETGESGGACVETGDLGAAGASFTATVVTSLGMMILDDDCDNGGF